MKSFFQKIGYKIAAFMYGRYGHDELNTVILVCALVVSLASSVVGSLPKLSYFHLFSLLSTALLVWAIFRMLSKNYTKRRKELDIYLRIKSKPANAIKLHKNKRRDKKTHVYFKCHKCRAVLRVPRGKGNIIVTCPRCGERIEKKT